MMDAIEIIAVAVFVVSTFLALAFLCAPAGIVGKKSSIIDPAARARHLAAPKARRWSLGGFLACLLFGHPSDRLEHQDPPELLHDHERFRCGRCGARVWR